MDEDLDGEGPQPVERAQQVTRRLGVKPVDDFPFTEHDERLQARTQVRGHRAEQRSGFLLTDCEIHQIFWPRKFIFDGNTVRRKYMICLCS